MNFDDVRYNLAVLEERGLPIYAEEVYNLFGLVLDRVLEASDATDSSSLCCEDKKGFVQAAQYILTDALKAFQANSDGIQSLTSRTQERIKATVSEAENVRTEAEKICSSLKESEELQKRLLKERAEAEEKNSKLTQIQTECELLSRRISELNDTSLADMESQLDKLKKEAAERESRTHELNAETVRLKEEVKTARAKAEKAEKETQALDIELKKLASAIAEARSAAAGAQDQKKALSEELASVQRRNSELIEYSAKYAEVFNAINAAINDPFTCENLFASLRSAEGRKEIPLDIPGGVKVETPSDLKKWVDGTQQGIEQMLGTYQEVLRQIVKLGEGLTVRLG